METRQVYHDESLDGDGHEAAPLQVSVEWLRAQILAFLPEVVKFTDCCGNDINIGDVLVTCEYLDQQLTLLANELKAYAEQQAAEALQDAKDYADEQDQNILQQANNYTDEKISNMDIPYLRNALTDGAEPLVSANGLALGYNTEASSIGTTAVGNFALVTGGNSTALGTGAMASGADTTALGYMAIATETGATALGYAAKALDTYSTALGGSTVASETGTTAIGNGATASGLCSTSIGYGVIADYGYTTALGYQAQVTGSNQVQLGNSTATTYAYGAVQDRSDKRDKTDVHNSDLGLEFIQKLRPVKFRLDYRDDYINELFPKPKREDFIDTSGVNEAAYAQALQAHQAERCAFMQNPDERKDGSKARQRYHYGLIADELKTTMDELGVDFGGYKDHGINGGMCVKSVGYAELISPLIKAVQELSAQVDDLKQQLEGK